ncbi:MAG: hypothetical protein RLZZ409_188, partial [Pseudomonadota bacterium]
EPMMMTGSSEEGDEFKAEGLCLMSGK